MINCFEISSTIECCSISIRSSRPTFEEVEENEYEMDDNMVFKTKEVDHSSELIFDISRPRPIILFENIDYCILIKFEESKEIELGENIFFKITNISKDKKEYTISLNSRNYVGILNLSIFNIFKPIIEVESRKINYTFEYNTLIQKISNLGIDLVSRASSNFSQSVNHTNSNLDDDKLLTSKFSFLKSILLSGELQLLYDIFLKNTSSRLIETKEEKNIWEIEEIDIDNYFDAIIENNNMNFEGVMIPLKMYSNSSTETVDTVENRFLKYFIEIIINYLYSIEQNIETQGFYTLKAEIKECIHISEHIYSNPKFKDISKLTSIPSKSNILHNKFPYKDIYKIYLLMHYDVEIVDNNIQNTMSMSMKDLPKLYEYYSYLEIINILNEIDKSVDFVIEGLLEYNSNNLCYILKGSDGIKFSITESKHLKLYYNKEYDAGNIIYHGRSYSHKLDPDISIEMFIDDSLVAIIHFDAKYKLESKSHKFKNEDIDKMHTYKDAIMGTIGAYVLYPGSKTENYTQEELIGTSSRELFPSVGAFKLNISDDISESSAIKNLIKAFIRIDENLINRGIFKEETEEKNYLKRLID